MKLRIRFSALWATGLLLAVNLHAAAADAQRIFRCGPDGREYSQTPCPGGRVVGADDARSPEQQQAAREVAERDKQLADQLARERRQREAAARRQGAASLGPAAKASAPQPAASAPHKQGKKKKRKAAALEDDPTLSPPMRAPAGPKAKP